MKRRLVIFLIILVSMGSLAARYTPPNYKAQHWDVALNAIIARIGTDVDTLYGNVTVLSNLVANWVSTVDSLTLIPAAPTYSDDHTFTVAGDYSALLMPGKRLVADCGADGLQPNTVVSCTYGSPNSTVVVTTHNLTSNLAAVSYYATRSGLNTYGSGDIVAGEYGAPSWANLQSAVAVATTAGRRLLLTPGSWPVTDNLTITNPVAPAPGAQFVIANTKTLTLNGAPQAGAWQFISWSGSGQVVFGPGVVHNVYLQWFGGAGDGATDNYPALAKLLQAVSTGMEITLLDGTYLLNPTAPLAISTGISFDCRRGTFTTSLAPASMPTFFFQVAGDDVSIDGMKFNLGSPTAIDGTGSGGGISLAAGVKNFTLKNSNLRYFSYCVDASSGYYEKIYLLGNDLVGTLRDVTFAGVNAYGRDIFIEQNRFLVQRNWTSPAQNSGSILVAGGILPYGSQPFSDTEYETKFFENVHVTRNQFYKNNAFPVRLVNVSKPHVRGNDWENGVGSNIAPGVANDNLVLDLCRGGGVQDNTFYGGGQNAIDILSCQHLNITGNTASGQEAVGLDFDASCVYTENPAITLSPKYLKNSGHAVAGNFLEAQNPIALPFCGDIEFSANTLKYYTAYSTWTSYSPCAVSGAPTSTVLSLIQSDDRLRPGNIRFSGTQLDLGERLSFTASASTGILTTSGSHDLATGEAVELEVGGDVPIVALPGGLTYHDTYYVIAVAANQLKLAASRADALASPPAPVALTTDGGGAGQILYLHRVWPITVYFDGNYLVNSNQETIELEEALAFSEVGLFSTLSIAFNGNPLGVRKHWSAEYLLDPAVDYTVTGRAWTGYKSRLPKYQLLPPFYTHGADTYGLSLFNNCRNEKSFGKGSKISELNNQPADGYLRLKFW